MPPLNLYARVRFLLCICTRDRGCSAHPAFPAPSFFGEGEVHASLGHFVPRERESMFVLFENLIWKLYAPRLIHVVPALSRDPYAAAYP